MFSVQVAAFFSAMRQERVCTFGHAGAHFDVERFAKTAGELSDTKGNAIDSRRAASSPASSA
jgi:hypothetical protein